MNYRKFFITVLVCITCMGIGFIAAQTDTSEATSDTDTPTVATEATTEITKIDVEATTETTETVEDTDVDETSENPEDSVEGAKLEPENSEESTDISGLEEASTHTNDGLFTPEQAEQGNVLYKEHCQTCHKKTLLSTDPFPPITGSRFFSKWEKNEKTIFELFNFVQTNMPLSKGGSLSEQEYFDLFAFWLSFNNYTEGDSPFNAEVLESLTEVLLVEIPTEEVTE